MPTRPTIPITVRASQSTYTTGPVSLRTTLTKIPRAADDITEGYKVDYPVGTHPVNAQEKNFEDNRNDLWIEWVSLGSNQDDTDAHIVETDSSGDINVIGVNCEDVQVATNGIDDGVEITANSSSKGINLIRDAGNTDNGILVTSEDGATGAAVRLDISGDSTGILINAQESPGLSILMTANGGNVAPHITMATTNQLPTGTLSAGDIWLQQQTGKNDLRCGIGTSTPGYIRVAKQAPCYARSPDVVNFVINDTQTNEPMATFSFDSEFRPAAAARVKVTIWGRIESDSNQDNNITISVRDKTASGNPAICSIPIRTPTTVASQQFNISTTYAQTYLLPTGGARDFDLVWSGTHSGGQVSEFTGWAEIEEIPGG